MDTTRRSILKMFGISGAVIATGAAAEVAAAAAPVFEHKEVALGYTLDYTPPPPPDGMTYQWKRMFITDDVPDMDHIVEMVTHGWKPVPASRHRETYPDNGSYWVEIGGLVLMEKPTADIPPPAKYPEPLNK